MKKLLTIAFLSIVLIGCKNDKTFVTLSGTVEHSDNPTLELYQKGNFNEPVKVFTLDDTNQFKDTITLAEDDYYIKHNKGYLLLHLRPGDHVNFSTDANDFINTLTVSGGDESINNYYVKKNILLDQSYYALKEHYALDEKDFKVKFDSVKQEFSTLLAEVKQPTEEFLNYENEDVNNHFDFIAQDYAAKKEQSKLIGKPSPTFDDYESTDGKRYSLSDFRGKFTYIDVWATWCRPCREEIPALKVLEEKYGDKINFVSISVDKPKDRDKWIAMIKDMDLKGFQLFANADKPTAFDTAYNINSIPRFILVDPDGKIYNPDAPRPSHNKTGELFQSLIQ